MSQEKIIEALNSIVHHVSNEGGWTTIFLPLLGVIGFFLYQIFNRVQEKIKEPIADWIVRQLQQFWGRVTSKFNRFEDKYCQHLTATYRECSTQGLNIAPFKPDLEKVFVPLRIRPESMARISPHLIPLGRGWGGDRIWDFLSESLKVPQFHRIAIIGAPGSGKTTLLQHLTLTYAQNKQGQQQPQAPKLFPILLYLRDWRDHIAREERQPDLATLIVQQQSLSHLKPSKDWFEEKLRHQPCLVMLDGLDEVADENQRKAVSRWVNQQIQAYPQARFLLTSRPFGYKSAPVEAVSSILEVCPFNLSQVKQFIQNWYLQQKILDIKNRGKGTEEIQQEAQQQAEDLIDRIQDSPPLAAMVLNPLLLTMIATVHCYKGELPRDRVKLYEEICHLLLGGRQEAKGIEDRLTASQKQGVLQVLALALMEGKIREFTAELGSSLIQGQGELGDADFTPQQFLEDLENVSGLLVEREAGFYEFAHKSFQEYLGLAE